MGSLHPFLDRNGAKTIPYRAAHAFMAYIWNKAPLPPPTVGSNPWSPTQLLLPVLCRRRWE